MISGRPYRWRIKASGMVNNCGGCYREHGNKSMAAHSTCSRGRIVGGMNGGVDQGSLHDNVLQYRGNEHASKSV